MKKFVQWTNKFYEKIKGHVVRLALVKLFGKVLGGFWGWIATEVLGVAFDKIFKPGYRWAVRKLKGLAKKSETKRKAIKVEEAKNEKDFDDSFDDLP